MRIGYVDEQGRAGEMELALLRQGDLVRFVAEHNKHGGDHIAKDEIGEVVAVHPEALTVTAPGRHAGSKELELKPIEVDLEPSQVIVLIDARDDRVSTNRIMSMLEEAERSPEAWRVYPYKIAAGPFKLPSTHKPGMAVPKGGSSCKNCRFLSTEGPALLCSAEGFVLWNGGPDIPTVNADEYCSDWYEPKEARTARLLGWELEAAVIEAWMGGADPCDRDMVAAELLRRAWRGIKSDMSAVMSTDLRIAARTLLGVQRRAYVEFVAGAGIARPRRFAKEEQRAFDVADYGVYSVAEWAVSAAAYGFGGEYGTGPAGTTRYDIRSKSDVLAAMDELLADIEGGPYKTEQDLVPSGEELEYVERVSPDPMSATPEETGHMQAMAKRIRSARSHVESMDDARWAALADWGKAESQPKPQPASAPVMEPTDDDYEINYGDAPPDPTSAPSYSVDPVDSSPIRVQQGKGPQRVWAEPGMVVYRPEGGGEGTVLGFSKETKDGIVVDKGGGGIDTWDAMAVRLSPKWRGQPKVVPVEAIDEWKGQRYKRLRTRQPQIAAGGELPVKDVADYSFEQVAAVLLHEAERMMQESEPPLTQNQGRGRLDGAA